MILYKWHCYKSQFVSFFTQHCLWDSSVMSKYGEQFILFSKLCIYCVNMPWAVYAFYRWWVFRWFLVFHADHADTSIFFACVFWDIALSCVGCMPGGVSLILMFTVILYNMAFPCSTHLCKIQKSTISLL